MAEGWIALHRRTADHWLWEDKPFNRAAAWVDLLLTVNWQDGETVIKNQPFLCKRGESLRSYETWGKRWGWNKTATRRFLKLLEKNGMISIKNETVTIRVSVCKYETYQNVRNGSETQVKRIGNASETEVKTIEQENKNTKEQEDIGASLVPSVPPAITLLTNDNREFPISQKQIDEYAQLYPATDTEAEFRKMKAWLISNQSKRKTWGGMLRFVNGWLSREQDKGGTKHQTRRPSNGRTYAPNADEYAELAKQYGIGNPATDERAGAVSDPTVRQIRGGSGKDD
jgi:hypothetical protein